MVISLVATVVWVSQKERNPREKAIAEKHWNIFVMWFFDLMPAKLSYFPIFNCFYTPYTFLVKEGALCTHDWSSQNGE